MHWAGSGWSANVMANNLLPAPAPLGQRIPLSGYQQTGRRRDQRFGSGPRPVTLDKARIEHQVRKLALEHAAGRLEDAMYLERLHEAPGREAEPRAGERRRDVAGAGRGVALGVVRDAERG